MTGDFHTEGSIESSSEIFIRSLWNFTSTFLGLWGIEFCNRQEREFLNRFVYKLSNNVRINSGFIVVKEAAKKNRTCGYSFGVFHRVLQVALPFR